MSIKIISIFILQNPSTQHHLLISINKYRQGRIVGILFGRLPSDLEQEPLVDWDAALGHDRLQTGRVRRHDSLQVLRRHGDVDAVGNVRRSGPEQNVGRWTPTDQL